MILRLDNGLDLLRVKRQTNRLMNSVIVRTVPAGLFEEISIEMPDREATFLNLIPQGKRIHYDVRTMPTIAKDIRAELNKGNYFDFILEPDHDQHFLVPKSN